MTSIDAAIAQGTDWVSHDEQDLGPLAWVSSELHKSLGAVAKAMRRFVQEVELARESDLASLDVSPLRIARQQLHQACGALEMVSMSAPALILRAMETAVQRFVQKPELCTTAAAQVIEHSSFALIEYLENVLAGKQVSAVALFPQYRQIHELAGGSVLVHPADLWAGEQYLREPELSVTQTPMHYDAHARAHLDSAVLRIVKSADGTGAAEMHDICLGLCAAQHDGPSRAFWKICAGFFAALAQGMLKPDVYVKRTASRVLLQYASLSKGDSTVAGRLVHDLLFFCTQANQSQGGQAAPALRAVRKSFALDRYPSVDYATPRFGLFDPMVLVQARKRMAAATETWSALAGGDRQKLKPAADQFTLVCESLRTLHPDSEPLAHALMRAVETTLRSGQPPTPALAMEVATAVLYLQASFEDLDTAQAYMAERAVRLAQRLTAVLAGGECEPLEHWMEELYRRVSDHQTMGSVVNELRATLAEAEKFMDQFFRNTQDLEALRSVPDRLQQMHGVLTVLNLKQAALAVLCMRETVGQLLSGEIALHECDAISAKLGNTLGALGFLIDMLGYQPALARKLCVYDEQLGELRILMVRDSARAAPGEAIDETDSAAAQEHLLVVGDILASAGQEPLLPIESAAAVTADVPEPAPASNATLSAPQEADSDDEADELLDIFLEEAREVVANGLAAIAVLEGAPGDLSEQTTLRRAFHTLKGSSRMVGLGDFGEAAWAMEQTLNAWLAEQKPIKTPLLQLSDQSLRAFGRWVDDIAAKTAKHWQPQAFQASADAMRLRGELVPLQAPVKSTAPQPETNGQAVAVQAVKVPDAAAQAAPQELPEELPQVSLPPVEDAAQETVTTAQTPLAPADADSGDDSIDNPSPDTEATEMEPALLQRASDLTDEPLETGIPEIDFQVFEQALQSEAQDGEEIDFATFEQALQAESTPQQAAPDAADSMRAQDGEEIDFATFEQALQDESTPQQAAPDAADSVQAQDGEEIDFAAFEQALQDEFTPPQAAPAADPVQVHDGEEIDFTVFKQAQSQQEEAAAAAEMAQPEETDNDGIKVIGHLRIDAKLYEVYLAEARGRSQQLTHTLRQWLPLHSPMPVPDTAVALAHSLAGSSATVEFMALSDLARQLEHALEHVQLMQRGLPEHALCFNAAAAEIAHLLHQFAAGVLVEPRAQVLEQLQQILHTEITGNMSAAQVQEEQNPQERLETQDASAPERTHGAVAAVVPPSAVDVDHTIDVADVIDPDLFPIFEEEALELLPVLGAALRQWAARPDNLDARNQLLRALHTLKGSARLAGAMKLGEMAHRAETAVEGIDIQTATERDIDPLLVRFDQIHANFDALRSVSAQDLSGPVEVVVQPAAPTLPVLPVAPVAPASVSVQSQPLSSAPVAASQDAARTLVPTPTPVAPAPLVPPVAAVPQPRRAAAAPVRSAAAGQTVRVRAQLLDRLVGEVGEVMIARTRLDTRMTQLRVALGDMTGNLERLRQQLRDIEVQAESQMQSRLALSKESAAGFDPLEFDRFTRVQELTRMMAESVNDVATVQRNMQRTLEGVEDDLIAQGRQARELQRDLLRTRMVDFDSISERLYAVVRLASKETGKQIKLDISGGFIEMDRGVLERMTPAFEHLLRNCTDHGIETPEERTAVGKPAVGSITIALEHEGNDVSVEFRDDGAGLNIERIRAKAVAQGMIQADASLTDAEAARLIFMPGFSTATRVTGVSGRGVGMDVVRTEINALGGRIETTTAAGKGSSFRMVLPLTTAVTQVVMLRAGNITFGVPASLVEVVRRMSAADLARAYTSRSLHDGNDDLPFYWAGALLQASAHSREVAGKSHPVLLIHSAAQRVALHVDEVLGNQEVVVKNLGPQLVRLPGLAGMSVLASGAVVLIYNPVALSTVYGEQVRAIMQAPSEEVQTPPGQTALPGAPSHVGAQSHASQAPLVLVVDDSITVRRVTQRLLQREGYRVALANDGLQALERLQEERPTVVLSDIEMPRMDGFDLARNIRANEALRDLPIIMITSRIAQKHREHALELGVDHYLGKPYSDNELLGLVQHYARLTETGHAA